MCGYLELVSYILIFASYQRNLNLFIHHIEIIYIN